MKILITGVNGFAASHLARQLVKEGHEVHGTVRTRSDLSKIKDLDLKLHLMEITDSGCVEKIIKEIQPDEIYHLAAQSYVKLSWDAPLETYRINVDGTINLLEAVRKFCPKAHILVTSTSEVYGDVEGEINEQTTPKPNTHYGISKYAQDLIAQLYHRSYGLNIVITRSFNITGPGRASVFVDSSFAQQIAKIEKGAEPIIYHGNLESERDFVDVRDAVDGYIKALRSRKWGEVFCFGSGQPTKIRSLLNVLLVFARIPIATKEDPTRLRPTDTKTMKCDYTKAREILGWKPKIDLAHSLEDLLNYWRQHD